MNKVAVALILTIGFVMGATAISYADGIVIPCSIKVSAFIKDMKQHGMDLSGSDDADGEVQNSGTSMKVITYKPVTPEQMDLMKDIAFKNVRN